eukprot:GHVU01067634.1.p1 GENE.GHVU01067634.1~~GHVU01067634.1.p1  ORF type:complete len:261 (+),score=33.20 GHVU01067634.1:553-1335(+)
MTAAAIASDSNMSMKPRAQRVQVKARFDVGNLNPGMSSQSPPALQASSPGSSASEDSDLVEDGDEPTKQRVPMKWRRRSKSMKSGEKGRRKTAGDEEVDHDLQNYIKATSCGRRSEPYVASAFANMMGLPSQLNMGPMESFGREDGRAWSDCCTDFTETAEDSLVLDERVWPAGSALVGLVGPAAQRQAQGEERKRVSGHPAGVTPCLTPQGETEDGGKKRLPGILRGLHKKGNGKGKCRKRMTKEEKEAAKQRKEELQR